MQDRNGPDSGYLVPGTRNPAPLPHSKALLPYCLIALLPYCPIALLPSCLTAFLPYYSSLRHSVTPSPPTAC